MKYILPFLLLFVALAPAHAQVTASTFTTRTITVPAGGFTLRFSVFWFSDDYPQWSAPGRVELRDAAGSLAGTLTVSNYIGSGFYANASLGTLTTEWSVANYYAADGGVADGGYIGLWHLTGVPAGDYTLRFYQYTSSQPPLYATTVWTTSSYLDGWPSGSPPTIAWVSAPSSAGNGQTYTISAHGHDADGNLAQVNVWKNGQPFAFAGGGNGTDGDSGNPTSDAGPQTITFTAQAVDADGAASPVISHVVTIGAPANTPPSVSLLSPGGQTVTAGTALTISARATDPDGNLSGHNLDIQRPAGDWNFQGGFATGEPYQGGPMGSGADSTRTASFTFSDVGTYYVRSGAYDGSGWYHSATVAITVTPANRAPAIQWLSAPASAGHQQGYTVSARGSDPDGNLTQVNVWKNGQLFAFAGGGNGYAGDSGNATADNGAATVTFTAQAVDAAGATSGVITHTVSIGAPPAAQYTLTTSAGAGGSVSPGGVFTDGTTATVTATPDATHDFTGWSGDAGGTANPVGVPMNRNRTVQANFTLKQFALTTGATGGGSMTPGGSYPYGTIVTLTAVADASSRFTGWAGDASGQAPNAAVTMTGPRTVQAVFAPKTAQTIAFANPGNRATASPPFALGATSSAGLPVSYAVLSGPAVISGDQLQITGPGAVTVQASQAGDSFYLPAPSITQTFNSVAAAVVKYRGSARTVLQSQTTGNSANVVLENP